MMSDPHRDETASVASSSMDSYATPEERQAAKLARFKDKKRQGSARSSIDGGVSSVAEGDHRPLPIAPVQESPSVAPQQQPPSRSSSLGGGGGAGSSTRGSHPTSPHSSPSLHRAKTKLQLLHERLQNEALNENSTRRLDSPTMPPEIKSASNSVLLKEDGDEDKTRPTANSNVHPQQKRDEDETEQTDPLRGGTSGLRGDEEEDSVPNHHRRSVSGAAMSPVPGATPVSGNSPPEAAPRPQNLGDTSPAAPTPAPLLGKDELYPTFSSPIPPKFGGQSSEHPPVDSAVVRVQEPSSLGDTGTFQSLPRVGSNVQEDREGDPRGGRGDSPPPPSIPPINMTGLGSSPSPQHQKSGTNPLASAGASTSSYPAPPNHAPLPAASQQHLSPDAAIVDLQRRLHSLPSTGLEAGRVSAVPSTLRNSSGSPSQRMNPYGGPISGASFTTNSVGILTDPVDFAYDYGGYTEKNRTMLMIKESEAAARIAIVSLAMDEKIKLALELAHGPQRALTEVQRRLKDTIDRCVHAEKSLRSERKHREILDTAREEERKQWQAVDAQELLPQIDHAREKGCRELAGAEQRRVSELEALKDSHENEIDALHRQIDALRSQAEGKEAALVKSQADQLKLQRELETVKTDLRLAKLMTPEEYAAAEQGAPLLENDGSGRNGSHSPEARRVHIDPHHAGGEVGEGENEEEQRWVSPMTDEEHQVVYSDHSPAGSVGGRKKASPKRLITALRLASKRSTSAPRREGKPHDPLERKSNRGVHNQDQKPQGDLEVDFEDGDGLSSVAAPASTFTLSFPELDHPSRRGNLFVGQHKASAWQDKYCFLSRGSFYLGDSMETKLTFTLHLSQVVRAQPFQGTHTTVKGHMKSTRKVHITHFFLVEYKPTGWRPGHAYKCLEFGLEDKFERNLWVEAFLFCKPQPSAMSATATTIGTKSIQSWAVKK